MEKVSEILTAVRREKRKHLLEPEAKTICQEYDIRVTRFRVAKTLEEAVKFSGEVGYPVVLKIVSPDIIHKSDIGGVMLNLETSLDVETAYRTILTNVKNHKPNAEVFGVLVQEMAPPSTEVIIGAIKDDQFGPSVMFGLGGIFVEVLKDVVFRIAPVARQEAEAMITEIKGYPVLNGYRNQPPLDTDAIADMIVNTSNLVTAHREIKELDLNPVMVYEKGAIAVDARVILE